MDTSTIIKPAFSERYGFFEAGNQFSMKTLHRLMSSAGQLAGRPRLVARSAGSSPGRLVGRSSSLANYELSLMNHELSILTYELSVTTYELSLMTYELSLISLINHELSLMTYDVLLMTYDLSLMTYELRTGANLSRLGFWTWSSLTCTKTQRMQVSIRTLN